MAITDADPRETTGGYSPAESAEQHEWWWLALKFSIAWALIDLLCGALAMPSPSTGVIAAGFLVSSPPVAAAWTTVWRIAGMFVGAAAGVAGAYWGLATGGEVPTLFFVLFGVVVCAMASRRDALTYAAVIGAVVGAMASRRDALTYAAVIGAVVAAQGVQDDTSVPNVAFETALQLVVGCAIGLAVIWAMEHARALWEARVR